MYAIYIEEGGGGGDFRRKMTKYAIYQGWKKKPGLKINKNSPVGFIAFLGGFYWSWMVFLGVFQFESSWNPLKFIIIHNNKTI